MKKQIDELIGEIKPLHWVGFVLVCIIMIITTIISNPKPLPELIDEDGDGYVIQDHEGIHIDCDDSDANTHPNAIDFPADGIDQDCKDGDAQLDTGGFSGTELTLYNDFIFTGEINSERIINNSRQIKITGELESAQMKIRASASEFNGDNLREHTVYFYIDSGDQGGHIGLKHENGEIISGTFKQADGEPPQLEVIYDLSILPLGQIKDLNPSMNLNVVDILNSKETHYIGSFVSTGIYGILNELTIEYQCKISSQCKIDLVK
jgi:hypothetical protein